MANYQLTKKQIVERGIPEKIAEKETLTSLAEIAAYMGCSINKVRDCIQMRGLPAAQVGQSYFTTKENVRRWMQETHLAMVEDYLWDKRIRPSAERKNPQDVISFRSKYKPRPTETSKRTRVDIRGIVHRLKMSSRG